MKSLILPLLLTLALLLPLRAYSQPDLRWIRFQDGYGKDDVIEDLAVDDAGNVYVAGWTVNAADDADYYIARYDPAGNRQWYHLYDNGGADFARSIAVKRGVVYVTGTSRSGTGFGANDDIVSFIIDTAGSIVPSNANALRFDYGGLSRDETAAQVLTAPDPGGQGLFISAVHADTAVADTFYVVGTHRDSLTQATNILMLMYDGGGFIGATSHQWPGDEGVVGMAFGGDGSIYVGATSQTAGANPSVRMLTVNIHHDLSFGWARDYSNYGLDHLLGITADQAGVYVTGTSYSSCGDRDVAVVHYLPDGSPGWVTRAYDCASTQVGTGAILVDDQRVYAAGYHANGSQYFALDKSDGTIRFQGVSPAQSAWVSVVKSFDGNLYFGGHRLLYDMPSEAVHLVRFDAAGTSQWDVQYDGSGVGLPNTISKMVSSPNDSTIILAGSVTVDGREDMMILKYGVGESMVTDAAVGPVAGLPRRLELYQNYPNPFNPGTTIRFSLPAETMVILTIYNALGEEVARPIAEIRGMGIHTVEFNPRGLGSGIYFARLTAGRNVKMMKMVNLR